MIRLPVASLLLASIACPAAADDPICGGISLVGEWIGGDAAGSDVSSAEAVFASEGQVPIAGHLVRMFMLSEAGDIRIDARAVPSGDPYIAIYDADGAEVASDDDGAGAYGSRVETRLDPGSYCLAVRSYEVGVIDVAVLVGRPDGDFGEDDAPADAPDDGPTGRGAGCFEAGTPTLGDGVDLDLPGPGMSATSSAADAPAYAMTLTKPETFTLTATSDTGDPVLRLLDRDGTVLAENDDSDELNSRIDVTAPLPAGSYCVEVEDLQSDGADITVALSAYDAAAGRRQRLDLAEISPTVSDEVPVTELGTLQSSLTHDVRVAGGAQWSGFDAPEGGLLLLQAIGNGADTIVTLFDGVGRKMGENDDGPQGLDSQLVVQLLPGSYVVAVRTVDASASADVRLVLERYIRAP